MKGTPQCNTFAKVIAQSVLSLKPNVRISLTAECAHFAIVFALTASQTDNNDGDLSQQE